MNINRDEWLSALQAAAMPVEDNQDAVSLLEFAAMFNLKREAAGRRLRALVECGAARETWKWTESNGRRAHVRAYVLVKP